jgi:hypothetical protein
LKNEGVPREKCWISAMKIGFHGENSELDNKKCDLDLDHMKI